MKRVSLFTFIGMVMMVLVSIFYSSCQHEPDIFFDNKPIISTNCSTDTVYFQNDVLPMIIESCATSGCHNAIDAKHGIVLVDYASVMRFGGINMQVPEESEIYEVLSSSDDRMPPPPEQEWSTDQKNILLTWIKQGAINNECQHQACDTTDVTYNKSVVTILQNNCYTCHNEVIQNGGINLRDYETVSDLAQSGKLLGVIKRMDGYTAMPPDNTLDLCSVKIIETWINDTTFIDPGGEDEHPCDPDTVYFQNDIYPLLLSTCATTNCHDAESAQDDVILIDYASIIASGKIKPGDAEDSDLFEVITETDVDKRMPLFPNDPLNQDQINMIRDWINQGAKNNYCDAECDTVNVTFSSSVWPVLEKNCVGCHSGPTPSGNILITDYNTVLALTNDGRLMGAIKHMDNYQPMPKNGPILSDCDIAKFDIWIENGKQND